MEWDGGIGDAAMGELETGVGRGEQLPVPQKALN